MEGKNIGKVGGSSFVGGDIFTQLVDAIDSFLGFGAHDPCVYKPCAYDPAEFVPIRVSKAEVNSSETKEGHSEYGNVNFIS